MFPLLPAAPSSRPNGCRTAEPGSADPSRAESWDNEYTFEMEGSLAPKTGAERQVRPLASSMNRRQLPRPGVYQAKDARGPDHLPASSPHSHLIFYT